MSTPGPLSTSQQIEALQRRNAELEQRLALPQQYDQDFYRFLFETMDEGFCIIEFFDGPHGPLSDYVHVVANAAYAKHAGIINVVGQCLRDMVPEEADEWVARYGQVLRTGEPLHFEQELIATGRVLSITTFRIEPADRRQVAVLFKDVTAQRQAERLLQELNEALEQQVHTARTERQLFAEVVESSVAGVHVLDHSLRWLAINHQGKQDCRVLYGGAPRRGDVLPTLLKDHPEDRDRLVALWQRALRGEAFMVTLVLGQQPEPRHYELRFNPILDGDAQVSCAYLIAYDISERIAAEQRLLDAEKALRQAHKMEAVGQLTGGIAHDFNNMLGSILGALEFMEQRLRQHRFDELQGLLSMASSTAQRASAMVQRLLAFARQQALQPRPTDVRSLVEDIEPLMRGSLGTDRVLRVAFAQPLWLTFIDPSQLENALLNLCLNARDAMQPGGTVTLRGENVLLTADQALELDLAVGEYVRVDVSDDGIGMAAEVAARAVDPFFTTKPLGQGTGLGLSMVYGFVRQSHGQLRIHSKPGAGTRIEIHLPRHQDCAASQLR